MKKPNGKASWIMVVVAVLVLAYNTVAVHVIAKNDIKHIQADVKEIKSLLFQHLIPDD